MSVVSQVGAGAQGGCTATGSGSRGVDELVIQSLSFPKLDGVEGRRRMVKFDLGELHALVDRGNLEFAFGLADDRGRVSNRSILRHLGWDSHSSLISAMGRNFLVIRPDSRGESLVDDRMRVALPPAMLRLCGLGVGRRVLLAATGYGGVLLVHPLVNFAHMVRQFHGQATGALWTDGPIGDGD